MKNIKILNGHVGVSLSIKNVKYPTTFLGLFNIMDFKVVVIFLIHWNATYKNEKLKTNQFIYPTKINYKEN